MVIIEVRPTYVVDGKRQVSNFETHLRFMQVISEDNFKLTSVREEASVLSLENAIKMHGFASCADKLRHYEIVKA